MRKLTKKLQQAVCFILLCGLGTFTLVPKVPLNRSTQELFVLSGINRSHYIHPSQNQQYQDNISTLLSLPANTQQSGNWGGYIVTPKSSSEIYTSISGSWTVPTITSNQSNALAGQWIGLGGVSSVDLLQIGTTEQLENGKPVAEVFWEKLPNVAQSIVTIPVGSTINASISRADNSGQSWNLAFTATTPNGETKSQTISVNTDSTYAEEIGTSAEWISEDPSYINGQLYPLANMGTVKYSSALANDLSIDSTKNEIIPVAMVSRNGSILIAPSTLDAEGKSFSTTVINSNSGGSSSGKVHHGYPNIPPHSGLSIGWIVHIELFNF